MVFMQKLALRGVIAFFLFIIGKSLFEYYQKNLKGGKKEEEWQDMKTKKN